MVRAWCPCTLIASDAVTHLGMLGAVVKRREIAFGIRGPSFVGVFAREVQDIS